MLARVDKQTGECAAVAQEAVRQASGAAPVMQKLAEASQKIGGVVKMISRIAGQTNLLALNASIEAARSGEAGKGFGVVASEVKDLARQTASATDQIADQILQTQTVTGEVSGALDGITAQINDVNTISREIAGLVRQQRVASAEINASTQQVAEGTREITRSIREVSDVARQTSDCASQLVQAADELSRQSETLRANLGNFLTDIRE
jgi:methyl-accepting chemotaxis protein